jgi:hypothetical protein
MHAAISLAGRRSEPLVFPTRGGKYSRGLQSWAIVVLIGEPAGIPISASRFHARIHPIALLVLAFLRHEDLPAPLLPRSLSFYSLFLYSLLPAGRSIVKLVA